MNIDKVTPGKMIDLLTKLYAKTPPKLVPAVMLWGQPGIGKSDAVRTLADNLQRVTGKTVEVTDVRLLLFNPIDLRGIPVADQNREFAVWLKPQIFEMTDDPRHLNILFLDEISAAPPSVQASAFQLTLDRKIGEHRLSDNTIIICAGNRMQDKGVTYKMPTPLANRLTHLEIVASLADWKQWAIGQQLDERVIGFLGFRESLFNAFDPVKDDIAFPTPRSWHFVSKYLKFYGDLDDALPMIKGAVGEEAASEFYYYCRNHSHLPQIDQIINGKMIELDPDKLDIIYAVCSALALRASGYDDIQLENVLKFLLSGNLARDYVMMTIKDMTRNGIVKARLKELPQFEKFLDAYGSTLLSYAK